LEADLSMSPKPILLALVISVVGFWGPVIYFVGRL
jgi:hypothetical protein